MERVEKLLSEEEVDKRIADLGAQISKDYEEALHGVANMGDVTVFPEPIGMAASFIK